MDKKFVCSDTTRQRWELTIATVNVDDDELPKLVREVIFAYGESRTGVLEKWFKAIAELTGPGGVVGMGPGSPLPMERII